MKNKIPTKNNAGDKRRRIDVETILRRKGRFNFAASVVVRMLGEKPYLEFVKDYTEEKAKCAWERIFTPTDLELHNFERLSKREITVEQFRLNLKLKTNHHAFLKIGKIYEYLNKTKTTKS